MGSAGRRTVDHCRPDALRGQRLRPDQHFEAGQRWVSVDLRRRQLRQRAARSPHQKPRLDFGAWRQRMSDGVRRVGLANSPDRADEAVLAAMVALAVIIEGTYRLAKREIRLQE